MELYQLEYFLEAARQRTFTQAAERLHLAQAALSEQMRKLEAELETPLFHRGRRETTLTPAGEVLREHAETLIKQAQQARRAVRDHTLLHSGRLVIAAIPSVSACLLPGIIANFCAKHPKIELTLLEGTSQRVAQWVEAGEADLGLVQLPTGTGALTATPLLSEPFVLLVPSTHPLTRQRRLGVSDLANEGFISYKGRARDTAQAACRAAGFEPRIVCETSELETIRRLVAIGLGVALLPAMACKHPTESTAVLKLRPAIQREVALLERQDTSLAPAAIQMKKLLLQPGKTGVRSAKEKSTYLRRPASAA